MYIKSKRTFGASLDDGLTVTSFPANNVHEVPDAVGKMAMEHYEAEEVKDKKVIEKFLKEKAED